MYQYLADTAHRYLAAGGPPGMPFKQGKTVNFSSTRAGRYVIGHVGPHESYSWQFSVVPWGAPLRENKDGSIEAYFNGKWQPIHKLRLWKEHFANNPAAVKEELLTRYAEILKEVQSRIGTGRRLPAAWKAGKLPDTWVFSDFGRITIKYFIDYNGNRKLDGNPKGGGKKETYMTDFMHTTPGDELVNAYNDMFQAHIPIIPSESHGCVRMQPDAISELIKAGILKVGKLLEVHDYSQAVIPMKYESRIGSPGTELHFFPGAKSIIVYNVTKI